MTAFLHLNVLFFLSLFAFHGPRLEPHHRCRGGGEAVYTLERLLAALCIHI